MFFGGAGKVTGKTKKQEKKEKYEIHGGALN